MGYIGGKQGSLRSTGGGVGKVALVWENGKIEQEVLGTIFVTKKGDIIGGRRKLYKGLLHNLTPHHTVLCLSN
jgi:hypothetical protein